ncbi:Endonuclease III [Entamoeba marina]
MKRSTTDTTVTQDEIKIRIHLLNEMKKYNNTLDSEKFEFGTKPLTNLAPNDSSKPFYAVIGSLLSTFTREKPRIIAMKNLIDHYKELTPKILSTASEDIIVELLDGCKWKNKKAKTIIEVSSIIHNKYNDVVPHDMETLQNLPGIGMKLANIICFSAFSQINYIVFEERTLILFSRLGWIETPKTNVEKVSADVQKWLPKELWNELPKTTITFTKALCKKKKPMCKKCPLADNHYCAYYCKLNSIPLRKPFYKEADQMIHVKKSKIDVEDGESIDEVLPLHPQVVVVNGNNDSENESSDENDSEFISGLDLVQLVNEKESRKSPQSHGSIDEAITSPSCSEKKID